jgi:outer membrane protein
MRHWPAYDHRPEMQSINELRVANDEQIVSLQKSHLPYVMGTATYYWANADHPLQENWDVGASVVLSLFNGGLTTARIGEAKANLSTLQFNEEALRQSIALEVRQALITVHKAEERIKVTQEGVDDARENVGLANGRYKTGIATVIELTSAQESLTSSEASRVQAFAAYKTAVAALERATGRDFGDE